MRDNAILLLGVLLVSMAAAELWAGEAATPAIVLAPAQIRIKDLADLQGVRENQLVGNGLVVGLDGTGDKSSDLANQELANFATRFGVKISADDVKSKNIAAVMVTAKLPPFVKKGAHIDVQVSSVGDARSLQGGILIQTPLVGADGRVYAVAQGALSLGGFSGGSSGGGGASVQKNHPLVGRIPNGAFVENEVASFIAREGFVRLRLRQPDFTTVQRAVDAINAKWPGLASANDLSGLEVRVPNGVTNQGQLVAFVAEMENLRITPDTSAKVVINERTGTIVAGADVRIAPTAVSHGSLFITVKNTTHVSQPEPFSKGETVVVTDQSTTVTEQDARVLVLEHAPTLGDLARALNSLKVSPRDIIAIFQALKDAGALHAELVIM